MKALALIPTVGIFLMTLLGVLSLDESETSVWEVVLMLMAGFSILLGILFAFVTAIRRAEIRWGIASLLFWPVSAYYLWRVATIESSVTEVAHNKSLNTDASDADAG